MQLIQKKRNIPFELSTYVVIGFNSNGGGVLASTSDEFTAHRFKRDLTKDYPDAEVMKRGEDAEDKILDAVCKYLGCD